MDNFKPRVQSAIAEEGLDGGPRLLPWAVTMCHVTHYPRRECIAVGSCVFFSATTISSTSSSTSFKQPCLLYVLPGFFIVSTVRGWSPPSTCRLFLINYHLERIRILQSAVASIRACKTPHVCEGVRLFVSQYPFPLLFG